MLLTINVICKVDNLNLTCP